MLDFIRNSLKKEEKIEDKDFSQLYKNMTKIYDFYDEEISRTGNMNEIGKSLQDEFEGYILYRDNYMKIVILNLDIEDAKIKGFLKIILNKVSITNDSKFLIENYFTRRNRLYKVKFDDFTHFSVNFNISELKENIKNRIDTIEEGLFYIKSGYRFSLNHGFSEDYLSKKLNPKLPYNSILLNSEGRNEVFGSRLFTILQYLKENIKNVGETYEERKRSFKLKIGEGNLYFISDGGFLYMGVRNLTIKEVEESDILVSKSINDIDELLDKKKKVAKIVKRSKQGLYTALLQNNISNRFIKLKISKLVDEYNNLKISGDSLYAPIVIDLLEDMMEILDSNISSTMAYKDSIQKYIYENYNQILDAIVLESKNSFIDYYRERLTTIVGSSKLFLETLEEIIPKINKFPEEMCINANIFDSLVRYITYEDIQVIINNTDSNRTKFIESLYKRLLLCANNKPLDLKKFENVDFSSLSMNTKFLFEEKIVANIAELLVENSEYVDNIADLIKKENLEKYILNLEKFVEKNSSDIHNRYNFELMYRDDFSVGKEDIDFSKYKEMSERSATYLMTHVIIPDSFYRLKKNKDIFFHQNLEELLKEGDLLNFLTNLGYTNDVVEIVKLLRIEDYSYYCNKILLHWKYLKDAGQINDYTFEGISKKYKEKLEENIKKLFDKNYKTTKELCFQIFGANVELTEGVQIELLKFDYIEVSKELAKRKELVEDIQRILANHWSEKIRKVLAKNKYLTKETQKIIARDSQQYVLMEFLSVKMKTQSIGALEIIADRGTDKTCLLLLKHFSKLSKQTQENLAEHWGTNVKKELAKRIDLSIETQIILANSKIEEVLIEYLSVERDNRSEDALEKIAKRENERVCTILINKISILSINIQHLLAWHPLEEVRNALFKSGKLSSEVTVFH